MRSDNLVVTQTWRSIHALRRFFFVWQAGYSFKETLLDTGFSRVATIHNLTIFAHVSSFLAILHISVVLSITRTKSFLPTQLYACVFLVLSVGGT